MACNSRLKFGSLRLRAEGWGATRLATGHYARVDRDPATGRYRLRRGADLRKDQSYFLYALTQQQLSTVLFPVGHLTKDETRRMARECGLPVAEKQESQEICFVSGDYRGYLRQRAAEAIRPGVIRDTGGAVRGRHPGVAYFTIGQRHGLGIHSPSALYVVALDAIRDEVIVGGGDDLLCSESVGQVNPIATDALDAPRRVLVKIRYAHAAVAATLDPVAPAAFASGSMRRSARSPRGKPRCSTTRMTPRLFWRRDDPRTGPASRVIACWIIALPHRRTDMADPFPARGFIRLAYDDSRDLVFGHALMPVRAGFDLTIGAGQVYPEVNFTLPPCRSPMPLGPRCAGTTRRSAKGS